MRVRVDQGADAVYLTLAETAVSESEEVSAGIVLDFDADGRVVGIEILDAAKRAGNPAALKDFSFELPRGGVRVGAVAAVIASRRRSKPGAMRTI